MKLLSVFILCLVMATMVTTPATSSGITNQTIQRKLDDSRKFQQRQSKKLEEMLMKLQQQFKKRREIPSNVRIPKRQYRYKK